MLLKWSPVEPLSGPLITVSDNHQQQCIACTPSERKSATYSSVRPLMPQGWSFPRGLWCGTTSKIQIQHCYINQFLPIKIDIKSWTIMASSSLWFLVFVDLRTPYCLWNMMWTETSPSSFESSSVLYIAPTHALPYRCKGTIGISNLTMFYNIQSILLSLLIDWTTWTILSPK